MEKCKDMICITKCLLIGVSSLSVLSFATVVSADPTIIEVNVDPIEPMPFSTVNFTVTINSEDNLDDVRLFVQECAEDMCFFPGLNLSTTNISEDTYYTQVTLIKEGATQIKYHLEILSNESWYKSETSYIDLKIDENSIASNNSNSQSTPGFEPVLIISSILLALILKQRKAKV